MILKNKIAVIYGSYGSIGTAVAKAFAYAGASLFLTGKDISKVEFLASEIISKGGRAEAHALDALDQTAVDNHLKNIIEKYGKIDVSFNAIGIPQTGVQGIPLTSMSAASYMHPIATYIQSHFITATSAARSMAPNKSGVILTLTAVPSKLPAPFVGGMAPSWAGIEAMTRTIAAEMGPLGIRAVCLRADGMPETDTITEVFGLHAKNIGMKSNKEFQSLMEGFTLLKRLPALTEIANAAVFFASDSASAITGTAINITCGSVID